MALCRCTRWYFLISPTSTLCILTNKICQTTGWGGQPVRAHGSDSSSITDISQRVIPVTSAKRIKVTFNASISDTLPWKFVPQQREVKVLPGETALAFYKATNLGDKDIIGVATYSVTPAQCAPYFSKIQCFCFEEQRLNAGETVDMPVFFYLDPDLLNDLNMKGIETVTLNYTFFSKFIFCLDCGAGCANEEQKRDTITMGVSSLQRRVEGAECTIIPSVCQISVQQIDLHSDVLSVYIKFKIQDMCNRSFSLAEFPCRIP